MSYTCLIVDDECLARELIGEYVSRLPELKCVGMASSAIEAKRMITELSPDIVFLDVNLPDLTGIELLQITKKRPATVLITAYSEYALEAYDLEVCDYLLKPVEFDRFYKAAIRAIEKLGNASNSVLKRDVRNSAQFIFVKADNKLIKVNLGEIYYIEGYREYVKIYTSKSTILTLTSLSKMMEMLNDRHFYRIHRSFIININHVDHIEGDVVRIGSKYLKISKGQKDSFLMHIHQ